MLFQEVRLGIETKILKPFMHKPEVRWERKVGGQIYPHWITSSPYFILRAVRIKNVLSGIFISILQKPNTVTVSAVRKDT